MSKSSCRIWRDKQQSCWTCVWLKRLKHSQFSHWLGRISIHALSLAGFGCACVIFKWANECHILAQVGVDPKLHSLFFFPLPPNPKEARLGEGACRQASAELLFGDILLGWPREYTPSRLLGGGWYLQKRSGTVRMSHSDRCKANLRIAGEQRLIGENGKKSAARVVPRSHASLWDDYIYIYISIVSLSIYIYIICL